MIKELYDAARDGNVEAVNTFIADGVDVNQVGSRTGATPLYIAAQEGHADVVGQLLAADADVERAFINGSTALFIAAQQGHEEVVALLLLAKADFNQAREDDVTPLSKAAENGYADVVAQLLAAGADVNQAAKAGQTPLSVATYNKRNDVIKLLHLHGAGSSLSTFREDLWCTRRCRPNHIENSLLKIITTYRNLLNIKRVLGISKAREHKVSAADKLINVLQQDDKPKILYLTPNDIFVLKERGSALAILYEVFMEKYPSCVICIQGSHAEHEPSAPQEPPPSYADVMSDKSSVVRLSEIAPVQLSQQRSITKCDVNNETKGNSENSSKDAESHDEWMANLGRITKPYRHVEVVFDGVPIETEVAIPLTLEQLVENQSNHKEQKKVNSHVVNVVGSEEQRRKAKLAAYERSQQKTVKQDQLRRLNAVRLWMDRGRHADAISNKPKRAAIVPAVIYKK
ncbi:MAG: ankyrin repeat domain-containing protein [Coxiellaceae bacterium]|nr:ankyrin repeat domain-containing protein [Coxiellaceae bacterium]